MLAGDVIIEEINAAANYDPSEAVDQQFVVGVAQKGSSTTPLRTFSFQDWVQHFGTAVAGSSLYQAVRTLFAVRGDDRAFAAPRDMAEFMAHLYPRSPGMPPAQCRATIM